MRAVFAGLTSAWRSLLGRPASNVTPTLDLQLRSANLKLGDWLERIRRGESRLYADLPDDAIDLLRMRAPQTVESTLVAADTVLEHLFNLLGSGDYNPLDPTRPARNGYTPIDWYLDPVSELRFPQGIPHKQWDLMKMRPGNADIKLPWELARCQHWPLLGQAWRLTGDRRYALEITRQLEDFMQANPVGIGINWTCTMDVALRALNWALGLALIKRCPELDNITLASAYRHLFDHGVFIFNNLENKYEVTSNHFLSNVVGLYYLASVFRELPEAQIWNAFCRESLEREIQVQVLEDGADYESSIPYHRLVTELFLGSARLADFRGQPLSENYRQRLKTMVRFMAAVLRPDGLMPQIGDADDGRLHILSGYAACPPQDPRHLFGPAALALDEPAWLKHAGPNGFWESTWWGFDTKDVVFHDDSPPPFTDLLPEAGLAVFRNYDHYLLVTNGIVGTKGFGNHKHNDLLSFEYHPDGFPLIVDPGSYVYTSDFAARNLFRSTNYHNTLVIDGTEQNETNPEWIFRLFEKASPETLEYKTTEEAFFYCGQHIGYTRLEHAVTHKRNFVLSLSNDTLSITDHLEGGGSHKLKWHFHLAPAVEVTVHAGIIRLSNNAAKAQYQLTVPANVTISFGSAWYSPSYGVRIPCQALELETEAVLPNDVSWNFTFTKID